MKSYFSGDIEVFKKFFCLVTKNYQTGEFRVFEISRRRNDIRQMVDFLKDDELHFFTYNGNEYDNIILNYIIRNVEKLVQFDAHQLCAHFKKINDNIFNKDEFGHHDYVQYKFKLPFKSIDIMSFWALSTIKAKQLSLKFFMANLGLKIEECPISFNTEELSDEDFDTIIGYCKNDVNGTDRLIHELREKINFRFDINRTLGFPCLSWSDVKIGEYGLLHDMSVRNNIPISELQQLKTHHEKVFIKELIPDVIKFKTPATGRVWREKEKNKKAGETKYKTCFDNFNDLLIYLKKQVVRSTKELNCRVYYKGVIYDIKSGGLHTYHPTPVFFEPKEDELLEDIDVSSYYPTIGSKWKRVPRHFKNLGLAEILDDHTNSRVIDKKEGRLTEADFKKLKLNGGFFGKTNEKNSAMYDWKCTLQITILGQLGLLMIAEECVHLGGEVLMCNTDGITVRMPKHLHEAWREKCKEWETTMRCKWEYVEYSKVYCRDINNYLAFYPNGKIKAKGWFVTEPNIDASRNFLIIPKAVKEFFSKGTNIEEFVRNQENKFFDYCGAVKISKKFDVLYDNEDAQQLNRYYVTKEGSYIIKMKDERVYSLNNLKGTKVNLFNEDCREVKCETINIDYNYYINMVKQEISKFDNSLNLPVNTYGQVSLGL